VSAGLTGFVQVVPSVTQEAAQFGAANNSNENAANARTRMYTRILLANEKSSVVADCKPTRLRE
jgi:hypothetical protein